jgi:hypothetical protein
MRRVLELGGVAAGVVLILFGVGALYLGVTSFIEVRDSVARENITATPDAAELTDGRLQPGQPIETGAEARAFADIMRAHALQSAGGRTFAELERFVTADGTPTNDPQEAATGPQGEPLENPQRQVWITQTALATALNMAFMAEQLSVFGIVVGIALLLAGVGFVVLATGGALRSGAGGR